MNTANHPELHTEITDDIQQLQEKIAFQENTIETLNQAVTNQQRQLNQLQEKFRALTQLLREWREDDKAAATDASNGGFEIPPHY